MTSEGPQSENATERPDSFSRRFGFAQYRAAWKPVGDGERLAIRQRECKHTFGRGYEPHGPARSVFRGDESEAREVHQMLGIMLGIRDPLDLEPPGSPDDRAIEDISAVEECDGCGTAPAAIVLVERDEDGQNWECYSCGAMQ